MCQTLFTKSSLTPFLTPIFYEIYSVIREYIEFSSFDNTERPISDTKRDLHEGYEIYKNDTSYKYSEFAKLLFKIAIAKLDIIDGLRDNYKNKDYTIDLIDNKLPEIKEDVKKLSGMHMKQWLETYKSFGCGRKTEKYKYRSHDYHPLSLATSGRIRKNTENFPVFSRNCYRYDGSGRLIL